MKMTASPAKESRLALTFAVVALVAASSLSPAHAAGYGVSVTPTAGLRSGDNVTVTVSGLSGNLGVYVSVCKAAAGPMDVPSICDQASTQWVTSGTPGSATSPVSITVQSSFDGKASPSAPTATTVNCLAESCVVYARGDHNNRGDYSLIRVVPLAFAAGGRVRTADSATASYGTTTLQPNQAGRLDYRTPVYLRVATKSGAKATLSSLTPDCAVNGQVVTALKGVGVCAIAATTRGNNTYAPLSVNFPFYLNPAVQTIAATWPKPSSRKVGGSLTLRSSAFKTSMEQPVALSTSDAACTVSATSGGWTVRFVAKGNCTLTAFAAEKQDKWTSATARTTYVVQ